MPRWHVDPCALRCERAHGEGAAPVIAASRGDPVRPGAILCVPGRSCASWGDPVGAAPPSSRGGGDATHVSGSRSGGAPTGSVGARDCSQRWCMAHGSVVQCGVCSSRLTALWHGPCTMVRCSHAHSKMLPAQRVKMARPWSNEKCSSNLVKSMSSRGGCGLRPEPEAPPVKLGGTALSSSRT